ncbi:MAG: glycosyltransferase family 2 protein [Bacteroidetes bacterium]|nr:glycosyltransferase family 2 protein [Bacteroidota bacterium]
MDNRVKSVSVITLNYNTTNHTIALLKSIERIYGQSLQVIVLDNGSTENPAGLLTSQFPWIDFIRSDRNLGFAGGNNLAMRVAHGEYLFFINNDTEFGSDILSRMINLLEQFQGIGLLCPTIHYYDQPSQVQYAGFTPINKITGRNECLTRVEPGPTGLAVTHYAHGAAMLVPRRVIDQIGCMPENYFLYYEELDWSELIRRSGYQIAVDTQSAFYHKESRSVEKLSELKSYLLTRNRILFMRKYSSPTHLILFWLFFLVIATPKHLVQSLLERKGKNALAFLQALKWNFSHATHSSTIGYKFNYLRHDA